MLRNIILGGANLIYKTLYIDFLGVSKDTKNPETKGVAHRLEISRGRVKVRLNSSSLLLSAGKSMVVRAIGSRQFVKNAFIT